MTEQSPCGPLERIVGRLCGIVPAALRAEKLMRKAEALSDLALDAGIAGRGVEANVFSAEAAKLRQQAENELAPYKTPNAEFSDRGETDPQET